MARTVKQVAELTGLPSRTVRYYDRIGLVSPEERSKAGYRLYNAKDEGKLHFVRQAKTLGFSLDQISELMATAERGCCGEVVPALQQLLDEKVSEADDRIAELRSFRERLVAYRAGRSSGCGCCGDGAFCNCLADAPLIQVDTEGGSGPVGAAFPPPKIPTGSRASEPAPGVAAAPQGDCGCGTLGPADTERHLEQIRRRVSALRPAGA
jgi:DNA-binding transcriptional MerR regulator